MPRHSPSAGGFRTWWRGLHESSDDELENAHLMRMAGRFSRRVRGWARANGVPVIDCGSEERKHKIAEEHLKKNPDVRGVFLVLGRAVATVWDVKRSPQGVIQNLQTKRTFISHYSFHIMDADWGHLTIKMAGHPPFGAQILLNGHEYVACQARRAGVTFSKEGNCFTGVSTPAELARVADTLSEVETIGRLSRVSERWISPRVYVSRWTSKSSNAGFHYIYSDQVEYSRNLLFHLGGQMEQVFQGVIDRTRVRLNVKRLKTLFGMKTRPYRDRKGKAPRCEVVVETPSVVLRCSWNLNGDWRE